MTIGLRAFLVVLALPAPAKATTADGLRLLRKGDALRAAAEFEQALVDNPNDADAAGGFGQALAKLGRRAEAEIALRRAIDLAPGRAAAYAILADLLAEDPARWRRRDEIAALLVRGLSRLSPDDAGRLALTLSLANFERSVGRTATARRRVEAIDVAGLSLEKRRRVLQLLDAIALQDRGLALRDWPEPDAPEQAARAIEHAEALLARGQPKAALEGISSLVAGHPGWRAPFWLRARAHEALGRYDDAQRDLTVLLQLQPSHAEAWRHLGRILAIHGGALEAERADRALREALAREPGWWDLWLLRAQVAVRRGRPRDAERALLRYRQEAPERARDPEVQRLAAAARAGGEAPRVSSGGTRPPTPRALDLLRQAQDWLDLDDPAGLAPNLLEQALHESPAFVDAAAMLYALGGPVPKSTVDALWADGTLLLDLARKVRVLGHDEARTLTGPWIDRAVELGVAAAYLERAVLRIDQGDRRGALSDLLRYMTSGPAPAEIDEARVLIASLSAGPGAGGPDAVAHAALAEERADEALRALGAHCAVDTPADRLLALGGVQEWRGDSQAAIACYREALRRNPSARPALARLAGMAARAPRSQIALLEEDLSRAADAGIAVAHLGLARLEDGASALARLNRFLAAAPSDDPNVPSARSMRDRIASARAASWWRSLWPWAALALAAAVLLALRPGTTLVRALQRRPALFPGLARAIAELRHDVLKHRTSVLGMAAPAAEIARVLWEPERASAVVGAAYESLRREARAKGIHLRRLSREPIFGPLESDLRRAEQLARAAGSSEALGRIGARLQQVHSERLAGLLRMGPRTRLDAAILTQWIRDVETELRAKGVPWTSPVVHLHGLELEFPVERAALQAIFANLLRNAEEAVGVDPKGGVLVRLSEERDETGRRLLLLLVGDSAQQAPSLEAIEARETGRGLAIVRDLVREWRGHLVIRPEPAPWHKGVSACFPA